MSFKGSILDQVRKPLMREAVDVRIARLIEQYPNSDWLRKAAPPSYIYPAHSKRWVNRFGINFEVDLGDYPGWSLYFHSPIDSSRRVLRFANEGDTVIDIGGNIGQTALMLAKKVGSAGKVISFEPFPESIRSFEKNLELNPSISNLTLVKMGLGDRRAKVRMCQEAPHNSAGIKIVSNDHESTGDSVEIEVTTLDEFMGRVRPERLDLIKIDVEGYEMAVLKGAVKTLREYGPNLFIEVANRALIGAGSSAAEVFDFLNSNEYTVFDAAGEKTIGRGDQALWHTDVFCRRRGNYAIDEQSAGKNI